jgi:hypothetical protein
MILCVPGVISLLLGMALVWRFGAAANHSGIGSAGPGGLLGVLGYLLGITGLALTVIGLGIALSS